MSTSCARTRNILVHDIEYYAMILFRMMVLPICALSVSVGADSLFAQQSGVRPDDVTGLWLTADQDAKIQIFKQDNAYCGKIVWMNEPEENGKPKRDTLNPDEQLRNRQLMNLVIMQAFSFDGGDEWTGGKIYDPKTGKEYTAKMSLDDPNTLILRGYVLVPLFGRSEKWTRVTTEESK